jgi:ADP-heptose:LPS heptosyltransferase
LATHLENKVKHIAVMRLSAMGDVAMTVPFLRAFAYQYPQIKVTIISRPFFKPFFDGIPQVSFFEFDEKNRHKGLFGLLRLFQDLQQLDIDAFADLHNVLRSKIIRTLFALSGKKAAEINKGREGIKALIRSENKILKPLASILERHAEVFRELGFVVVFSSRNSETIFPEKVVLKEDITAIIGMGNQKLIGIAPFAQYDSKIYPLDLMRIVIETLAKNTNIKILLFGGGKKEVKILDFLSEHKINVINVAGKINLKKELELISNLDVMLSMDSGNGHIAAMLGVKVITLYGATHPFAGFSPFNQPIENALVSDRMKYPLLPTSVYGNKIVAGYQDAMRTISPDSVVEKINTSLK